MDNAADSQLWRAHRCICNWIEQSPGQKNLALLAWHLEHATPPGDNAELTKLHLDGGHAMLNVYDLERSQWHFDQALQRTEDTTHRTDALEGSADVALLRGDTKRALQNYLECIENAGDPLRAVGIAAKATHAFFRKSAKKEALILAETALKHAGEPLHRGSIRAFFALFWSIIGIPLPPRAISAPLRDALCQLYITLIAILAASEPLVVMISLFRAYRHGKQLNTGEAASALAFFSTFRATIGHHDASRRHLIEAERIARRANSDRGLGVVQHMRGQNQLAIGNYAAGQRSLDLAIKAFHRTGDLSVAVLSLTLRALYGVNRESTSTTLEWLEDADSAAARQGNELARPAIAAMQAYVHLRSGRHHNPIDLSPLSERLKSIDASSTDLVVAHSYLALAGVLSGDIGLARDHAEQATHTLRSLPGTLELLHIAYVATAEVLLSEPSPSRNDRAKLVRVMKKIRNAAKQSPRFAAAYPIYRARHFISVGRSKEAKEALARVIETTARHGERYLTMQAHLLMADTVAGTDVLAAAEHLNMARNLAKELELPVPTRTMVADTHHGPIGRLRERPVHTTANLELVGQGALKTRAEEVIFRLRPSLHAALPRHAALKMRVDSGIMVDCSHAELELLVVNLVLAARDAITKLDNLCVNSQAVTLQGDEAARLTGGRAGEFLKLEIVATGEDARTPMLGGLSNCRSVTRRLQGFLDIPDADENTICISAFLPAQFPRDAKAPVETALQSALVIHPDVRIRQALVTSLNELGIDTQEVDANGWLLQPVGDDCVVFADAQTADRIEQMGCAKHIVHLVRRQEKRIEGKHCLRMPFSLGEIEGALAAFSPSSTDIAEQPG